MYSLAMPDGIFIPSNKPQKNLSSGLNDDRPNHACLNRALSVT
jgi:hypothetical protein